MNERETEARLRGWIEAQASPVVPDDLRRAVAAIPATVPLPWSERLGASLGWRPAAVPRLAWVLLLAGLLLALVIGSLTVGARRPDRTTDAPVPGLTWARVPDDAAEFGDAFISSVTAGGPGFVAVGSHHVPDGSETSAAVWVSADGYAWTRVAHDEAVFGGGSMAAVTTGGPGLVAVGSGVWLSVDGYTWTRVDLDEAVFGGYPSEEHMVAVTAGGPGLVAVGEAYRRDEAGSGTYTAVVWVSTDGYSWSRVPGGEAVFGAASGSVRGAGAWMTSVTAGGPGVVAVGCERVASDDWSRPAAWVSADGATWVRISGDKFPDDPVDASASQPDQCMTSVTAGGPGLVAVGWDRVNFSFGAVWVSVDGYTWSRVPHDAVTFGRWDISMSSVTAGGPGLVAVGSSDSDGAAAWTSVDGYSWSRVSADVAVFGESSERMESVAAGGPVIVAVGTRPCRITCANHSSGAAWVSPPAGP